MQAKDEAVHIKNDLLKRLYACHECSTCQNAVECTAANDAAASSAVFMYIYTMVLLHGDGDEYV